MLVIALVFIGIFSYIIPYSKGYQAADKDHQSDYNNHQTSKKAEQECINKSTTKEAISCYRSAEHSARDKQRSEQDLDAQREMANWAEGILWATLSIGGLSILVTILGMILIGFTLHHTKRAADAAFDMVDEAKATTKAAQDTTNLMRNEQRPWITFDLLGFPKIFDEDSNIVATVGIGIENIGKSIAVMGQVAIEFSNGGSQEAVLIKGKLKINTSGKTEIYGISWVPRSNEKTAKTIILPDFLVCKNESSPITVNAVGVNILISYRGADKAEIFHTFKSFLVSKRGGFSFHSQCDATSILKTATKIEEDQARTEYY